MGRKTEAADRTVATHRLHFMSDDESMWYEPEDPPPQHPCPCCDYVTLPERGSYLICPVYFWEDDGGNNLGNFGPNKVTLRQGRKTFCAFGACEIKMVKHVCSVEERKQFVLKRSSPES